MQLAKLVLFFCLLGVHSIAIASNHYIEDAKAYLAKGEVQSGIIQLKNHLKQKPNSVVARHLLGITYFQAGKLLQAENELQKASRLAPKNSEVQLNYASVLLDLKKYKEVIALLNTHTVEHQDSAITASMNGRYQTLLGYAFLGLKENLEAQKSFQAGADKGYIKANIGLAKIALLEEKQDKALLLLEKVLAQDANDQRALQLKALVLNITGDSKQALSIYHRLIKEKPHQQDLFLQRAATYLALNQLGDAEKDIQHLLSVNKQQAQANFLLSKVRLIQKNYPSAQQFAQKVLNSNSRHYPSILILGISHYAQGHFNQADKYLTQYLSFQPENVKVQNILANVYLAEKKPQEAILILSNLSKNDRENIDVLLTLGSAYLLSGDYPKGLEILYQAKTLAPNNKEVQKRIVASQFQVGNMSNAIKELEAYIPLVKDSLKMDSLLIASYIQQGLFKKAEKKINHLISIDANKPILYVLRAAIEKYYLNNEQAKKSYDTAITIDQKFIPAYVGLAKTYYEDGAYDKADQVYRKIITINSHYNSAYIALANLAEKKSDLVAAEKLLIKAYTHNKESVKQQLNNATFLAHFYDRNHLKDKMLWIAQDILKNNPEQVEVLAFMVDVQLRLGHLSQAEALLQEIIHKDKETIKYRLSLAAVLAKQNNRNSDMERILNEAFQLDPTKPLALVVQHGLQLEKKQYKKALKTARQVMQSFPRLSLGEQLEADILWQQKHFSEAIRLYKKAYQKHPNEHLAIKIVDAMNERGNRSDVMIFLKQQIKQQKNNQRLLFKAAKIYQKKADYEQALYYYSQLLKQQIENAIVLNNMAWIYAQQNNPKAIDFARRAYNKQPASGAIADTYGYILLENKKPKEALRVLKRASELAPDIKDIRYHLALAYNANGKRKNAIAILEKLIEGGAFVEKEKAMQLLQQLK